MDRARSERPPLLLVLDLIRAAAGLAGPYEFLPLNVASSINAFGRAPDPTQTQPVTFVRPDAPPIWLGHGTEDVIVHAEDTVIQANARRTPHVPEALQHQHAAAFAPAVPVRRGVERFAQAVGRQHLTRAAACIRPAA